jgi:hypothetical protein
MNLRFASNSIRVRVSRDEFERLRNGTPMGLEVSLPRGHTFRAKVNLSNDTQWRFDSDPTGLWLSVPRSEADALANDLPSREGIGHEFETNHGQLEVSFEVDVKTR